MDTSRVAGLQGDKKYNSPGFGDVISTRRICLAFILLIQSWPLFIISVESRPRRLTPPPRESETIHYNYTVARRAVYLCWRSFAEAILWWLSIISPPRYYLSLPQLLSAVWWCQVQQPVPLQPPFLAKLPPYCPTRAKRLYKLAVNNCNWPLLRWSFWSTVAIQLLQFF